MFQLDEIVREFLVESCENLDRIDRDLVALEQNPEDRMILAGIFRSIHTIKGTCGFLGFNRLESVSHVGENLLSKLRDGELKLSEDITSALLTLVDAVRTMLGEIENTGTDGTETYAELVSLLTELQTVSQAGARKSEKVEAKTTRAVEASKTTETSSVESASNSGNLPIAPTAAPAEVTLSATTQNTAPSPEPIESQPKETVAAKPTGPSESKAPVAAENNIRVDVGLLDRLMNLVGELVLARNQILQFSANLENPALVATTQRLNLITTELQEGVMKTRMQPIGNIWSKFPRVVRDLSVSCGKQVRVEMEGAETELDKTIIEAIKDPLTHIVRNSVDHGIESPDARRARGKSPEGRLSLRAYHESGQVNIEISDDGGGIDPKKVKAKALERRLITHEQADKLTDREATALIFLPGFSTAEKITNVSGRGVGMDVVKTNIERIGGLVDIQSNHGVGTTIRIKIPLTLAIIPALMVNCDGDRFAIPQISLLELLRIEPNEENSGVEFINGTPIYRLRGNLLPLLHLGAELGIAKLDMNFDKPMNVVVLQADDRQFGLIVDEIHDTGEIVVKPLSKRLKSIPIYAGATILGDGQVALILDVMQLAQRAHVVSENRSNALGDGSGDSKQTTSQRQSLLLFEADATTRCAIPLSSLTRLEEIDRSRLEYSGGQMVVQYRDRIMPLIDTCHVLGRGYGDDKGDAPLHVLVYSNNERTIGLLVNRIADIVHEELTVYSESTRPEIACTSVVQGKVTDIVNVDELIRSLVPQWSDSALAV